MAEAKEKKEIKKHTPIRSVRDLVEVTKKPVAKKVEKTEKAKK